MLELDALPSPLADPPVRTDGGCAKCFKPRRPERSAKYGGVAPELDPFCSSECCRAWHGTPIREVSIWGREPLELEEPARG